MDSPEVQELCETCDKRLECLADSDDHHVVMVGDEKVCVAVKPLTILVPSDGIWQKITIPDAVEIGSPETLDVSRKLIQAELDALHTIGAVELFDLVFKGQNVRMPKTVSELRISGDGVCHIIGMIVMIIDALEKNKRIHLRHPETHLHPKAQAGLANMVAFLVNSSRK